jgi:hypothetical protein
MTIIADASAECEFRHKVGAQLFESAHHTRDLGADDWSMQTTASIGFATSLLELAATSVGYGVVVGGFVASGAGMFSGWSRKEMEASAFRDAFWGGLLGILCLCIDLYPQ